MGILSPAFPSTEAKVHYKEESIKICGKVHETVSFQCYQELSNIVVTKIKTRLTGVIILLW